MLAYCLYCCYIFCFEGCLGTTAKLGSIKYSVYNTLTYRARTVCSDQELLRLEQQHIKTALSRCNYWNWVFQRLQTKLNFQLCLHICKTNSHSHNNNTKHIYMVVPYSKVLSENFKSLATKCESRSISRGAIQSRGCWWPPRIRITLPVKEGLSTDTGVNIWDVQQTTKVRQVGLLGETQRTPKSPSHIYDHAKTTSHTIQVDNFSMLTGSPRVSSAQLRRLCSSESMTSLNRNISKYQLSHSWDELLHDTLPLHLQSYPPNSSFQFHMGFHPLIRWGAYIILVSMVLPGVPSLPSTQLHIGTKFSHHILKPKRLVSITFSVRPEEAF